MFREQAPKRLAKKAKKGFRGFPVATVAFYGPDNRWASKLERFGLARNRMV
jgi:hypothetical protein